MNAIVPVPRSEISIRPATMEDLPFLDALQKQHNKALGFFPRAQMEGYVSSGWVLIAQDAATTQPLGYVASRDRYLKRDELGIIYQLCVSPGAQRKLVGAALVREVLARSAYGCRLYCCWCAQDLAANFFWESMGFVPIAFRAGSSGKKRVHIFWQKRIVEGDIETKWWYPSQTNQGAIREDRLVFPIPPGVHWRDVQAVVLPSEVRDQKSDARKQIAGPRKRKPAAQTAAQCGPAASKYDIAMCGLRFETKPAVAPPAPPAPTAKPKRQPRPKVKNDPKLVAAARELRDRWLEQVNAAPLLSHGKYDVSRALPGATIATPVVTAPALPAPALPAPLAA